MNKEKNITIEQILTIINENRDLFLIVIYVNVTVGNKNKTCIQVGSSKGPVYNKIVFANVSLFRDAFLFIIYFVFFSPKLAARDKKI